MELYSSKVLSPSALAIAIYFVQLASISTNAQLNEETWRTSPEGPYALQSWTHEPMFVDEPQWILLSPRTRGGQSSSEDTDDDHFWVTRGRKRSLHSPRPPILLGRGAKDVDDDDSWTGRGKKGTFINALENDPFWVNRGKRDGVGVGQLLSQDPYWANRGKKGDLSSALGNGDQFWVNRGKKSELQSLLHNGDQFWVNRGKKNELQSLLNNKDQFWVNRGKKNELQSLLNNGDQFWVNRGKKNELQSLLNNGDQFWVNRGKKNELQSLLNNGDQFWVNRGKKNELQSILDNGDQFWVNRGKKNELQSLLNNVDQFWVNRGKKNELQSLLNNGDQFWVNRGKKSELQSLLNNGDQFWVNRGKKNELQSLLNNGDQFWVNRGKKTMTGKEKEFYVKNDFKEEDFPQNRVGSSDPLFPKYLSPAGSLFWTDSDWNDRFKKGPLMTIFKPDPFFVNRGKKADALDEKIKPQGNTNETLRTKQQRNKQDKEEEKPGSPLLESAYWHGHWLDRAIAKKTNDGPTSFDPFWVTRGKRLEMHNRNMWEAKTSSMAAPQRSLRHKRTAKAPRVTSSYHPDKDDVNSLVLTWTGKPDLSDVEDDSVEEELRVRRQFGDDLKHEPFLANRGKKDANVSVDEFHEEETMVPEKRAGGEVPELGTLTQPGPGDTFWVARG